MVSSSGTTGVPSSFVTSRCQGVRTASSSSDRAKTWRVWPMSAGRSEASSAVPSCSPSTTEASSTGRPRWCGLVGVHDGDGEHAADLVERERVAWESEAPAVMWSSIRWARTSVSVADAMAWPFASSRACSSAWFSMMPLCTTPRRPVQYGYWGCAFSGVGLPWVAQRV